MKMIEKFYYIYKYRLQGNRAATVTTKSITPVQVMAESDPNLGKFNPCI